MKRKIIKQGHNTLTVTLPIDWVKERGISAGDEIDLSQHGDSITLAIEKKSSLKKATLNITDMPIPLIWKHLSAMYRKGYSEIDVLFCDASAPFEDGYAYHTTRFKKRQEKNIQTVESIRRMADRFVGLELVDQSKKRCVLKIMGEVTGQQEFDPALSQIFFILKQIAEYTMSAFDENQHMLWGNIINLDVMIDKFHDYCCRILTLKGYKIYDNTKAMFTLLYILELIGDEYKHIAIHGNDLKNGTLELKVLKPKCKDVTAQLELVRKLFYKYDKEAVMQVFENDLKIYKANFLFNKSTTNKNVLDINHHLRKITKFFTVVVELIMEMNYSSENSTC